MARETMTVSLGRTKLAVPVCVDEQTTVEIAERVSKLLAEAEEKSDRIDSQAFALLTAYRFAAELVELELSQKESEQDVAAALDRLKDTLASLVDNFSR